MQKENIIQFKEEYLDRLREDAALLINKDLPELTEEKFALTEQTGNRIIYEADYFEVRRFLCVYGALAIYDEAHRADYLPKLSYVIDEILKERCWALPAHVDRANDPDWEKCVELFASETGEALSEIIYKIGEYLPKELVDRVRENVIERVIVPFESREPYAWWETSDMNWNAVCNGSIGIIALYLLGDDKPRQAKLLKRVCKNLDYFIDGYGNDGTCYEGLGYFSYGMYFYIAFTDLLKSFDEYKDYYQVPAKVKEIAAFQQKCFFKSGATIPFSDGSREDRFKIGLTLKLMMKYDGVKLPAIERAAHYDFDTCYRFLMVIRDLQWTDEYLQSGDVEKTGGLSKDCYVLPDSQWAIFNSAGNVGMACKGGHNDEPHNHNDVGSFLYVIGNEFLLTDLGAGEYTKQYFNDDTRYDIFCNNSLSHNLPIIDGGLQQVGREHACDGFEYDDKGCLKYSLAKTYANSKLNKFIREFNFDDKTGDLQVTDTFDLTEGNIIENLVTQSDVEVLADGVLINGEKHSCRVTIDGSDVDIQLKEESHVNHEGKPEKVTRILFAVSGKECKFIIKKVR